MSLRVPAVERITTEYTVCALPQDHPGWRHYAIQVRRLREPSAPWIVHHKGMYLRDAADPDLAWTDDITHAARYSEDAALKAAEFWAEGIEINDVSVDEALAGGQ